jgi:hypothetical protein
MKKTILLVVMLTLVAFVSGAIAQAPAKPAPASTAPVKVKPEKFSGEIKSVDAMAKSIVVTGRGKAGEKTFVVTADTKIMKGKEAIKFEDLKAGAHVHIEYTKEMDKNAAATIKAFPPKAHPNEK